MNSILSYIAGLVLLLLIAALVGPAFVDWNSFRGEFESQGRKLTGRELKIGGDISFVLLPAPRLTINDVSLANVAGSENPDFARVGQIDAEVALAPLLSGEISVASIKITRPQIHLEVGANGHNNWRDLLSDAPMQEDGLFGLSSVSLEKASFEEGTVTYVDHRIGRNWRVEHVNGNVMATSLVGPIRSELSFENNGIPFALRIALGNFSNNKAFPITAELQSLKAPAKLLFSGVSTGFSSNARVDGTGSLELGSTRVAQGEKPRAPLRIEAGIVSSGESATFRNLVVAMAGTTLKGDAQANWRNRPTASIRLTGEALTLDPLIDRLGELAIAGRVPFGDFASLPVPGWIDVDASVKIDGLLVRDVLVKGAVLDATLKNGALTIARARGDIAGGTSFEMSGALSGGATPHFDGKIAASSGNIGALARWLATLRSEPGATAPTPPGAASAPSAIPAAGIAPRRPFAIASRIGLTPERLDFTDLAAAYATSPEPADVKGSVSFTLKDNRTLVSADLVAKTFDLDPLRALWPADAQPPLKLLETYDLDLIAKADRLTVGGNAVSGLDMSASVTHGTLDLKQFAAADFAGARIALAGTLSGVTANRLDALQGKVSGTLSATKTDDLLKLLDIRARGLEGPAELALDFSSGEAVDSNAKLDTLALKGSLGASRVDAVLKRGRASDGAIERIDLNANATSSDGGTLLRQLGLEPQGAFAGAGTASLQLSGTSAKPYNTTLRVNVGEGTFTAKGVLSDPLGAYKFTGHADISASGIRPVLAAFGVPKSAVDFSVAQAAGPSFVLAADIKSEPGVLAFNSLEVVAGNMHVSGAATYTRGAEGALPKLSGKFDANALDLTPIFVTGKSAQATTWPTAALDWSDLGLFEGNVGLKVGTLSLGSLKFNGADMQLALAGGVLSVSPMTAKFADGKASLATRIEAGKSGEPHIGMTFNVEDADMAQVGAQAVGTSFATGRATLGMQVEARGRSWLALVSSVGGAGSIKTRDAAFAPLDVAGFSDALKSLKTLDQLSALPDQTLAKGATPVTGLDGDFAIKDGLARIKRDDLALKGGKGKLNAMFDLPRLVADGELDVVLAEPAGAPAFSIAAAGKVGEIERRMDTLALQQLVAKQVLAKSAAEAGVNLTPRELRNLTGLSADEKAKGPAVAGIPLPLARPGEARQSLQ